VSSRAVSAAASSARAVLDLLLRMLLLLPELQCCPEQHLQHGVHTTCQLVHSAHCNCCSPASKHLTNYTGTAVSCQAHHR
jgi:hypothetical protein